MERKIANETKCKHVWQMDSIRVEFDRPEIQAVHTAKIMESSNDIMYYYYTVRIYKYVTTGYDEDYDNIKNWVLFKEIRTYDFDNILVFHKILKDFIDGNIPAEDGQKIKTIDETYYVNTLDTTSMLAEDYYAVSRIGVLKDKNPEFNVSIGGSLDNIAGIEIESVTIRRLNMDNIKNIYEVVDDFINYSIQYQNEKDVAYWEKNRKSYRIRDGRIYKLLNSKKGIEDIFVVGDKLEVMWLQDLTYRKLPIEKDEVVITEIKDNEFVVRDFSGEEFTIDINMLIHTFGELPTSRINLGMEDLAKDFVTILGEKEKEEFRIKDNDKLFRKYQEAIINRGWMCRSEHDFIDDDSDIPANEQAKEVVKRMIPIIKSLL